MELQEILKGKSVGEAELKVLTENLNQLSEADKIRFGFIEAPVKEAKPAKVKEAKPAKKAN